MKNILLDYVFKIASIIATAAGTTAFLKQVIVVVKKTSGGVDDVLTLCISQAEIAAVTDNLEAQELFNAGMTRVHILTKADLNISSDMVGGASTAFTVLISSDFSDVEVASLDLGTFKGVVGVSSDDKAYLKTQAAIANRCAFFGNSTNKAKNMMFAFGKILSNQLTWNNQQYVTMPYTDDIDEIGEAELLYDDRISFAMIDAQFGKRLGFFVAGGKAITAPYIIRNLEIDMQSAGLNYISGNQPDYVIREAVLLETELQEVIDDYIDKKLIDVGTVTIKLENDNFASSAYIDVSEPKGLWRIFGQLKQG